jgi:hypothetical protein
VGLGNRTVRVDAAILALAPFTKLVTLVLETPALVRIVFFLDQPIESTLPVARLTYGIDTDVLVSSPTAVAAAIQLDLDVIP